MLMAQRVHESIEVDAPVDDVFRYWSNFENFPTFMSNVEEVRISAQDTSNWRVKGPLGKSAEFDAKMNYADPPGGAVGETVANILSNPERNLKEDLQNFARIVERGELGGPEAQTPSR